ncbi:CehA/McbA family metallohydrolase [Paenibacillus tarimensis]|uniref:CehA/McbA family metallohydrolase n=1 Tax=Paenibacillus tarimensis TaxID=416012 RepID=UPI001F208A9E|nr:CehA/McbA family metallohydrolase [Paenibacillus tarimensis]MCF2944321.1 CehA/McbA family metallohydrolase [Paenibacillus tarimensis]
MNWIPFELHTHTPHSDGRHSLLEMCREAKKLGLGGIALTDHNTVSGMTEAEAAQEETGVAIVPGMEWTTFYGHMLTLGAPYCEWRDLGPEDIHRGIERVHQAGGIVGIAHPYSLGSPICTGCHWEYTIKDWSDIDYIEVWHEVMPSYKNHNVPAWNLWTSLLNEGYRIPATAGRDWHHSGQDDSWSAFTYIGLPEPDDRYSAESVVQAIRRGRSVISMGPMLHVEALAGDARYFIGDIVEDSAGRLSSMRLLIQVQPFAAAERYGDRMQVTKLVVESNIGELADRPWNEQEAGIELYVPLEGIRWLRLKAMGVLLGGWTTIAFTNPIYVNREQKNETEGETE